MDFITSPGYLTGRDSRRDAGLLLGWLTAVVTNLALMPWIPGGYWLGP